MLALVTGRGALPAAVAAAQVVRPLICTLEGHLPDGLTPDIPFRIEHLGTLFSTLKTHGVTEICLCGAIDRPQIDLSQADRATLPLMDVLGAAVVTGEDSALQTVVRIFEQAGFTVRAAHDLAPDLIPPAGVLSRAAIPTHAEADVAVARRVLEAQGAADLGQACVVQGGKVRAREDARGTDAMLEELGSAPANAARAGLLFKAPKPGQDIRVDMPTIGPVTAAHAVAAGLEGIVIAQGGVIVLDRARVLDILNTAGMYLWLR